MARVRQSCIQGLDEKSCLLWSHSV